MSFYQMSNQIQISPSCILTVPIQTYANDFTFIVNGDEFKTSRLISDLISPVICKIHSNDPTVDTFTIKTSQRGDFSQILNLFNFDSHSIPTNEVAFITEVIELLGNDTIEYKEANEPTEITTDNVFNCIKQHERNGQFYFKRLSSEIDFISSHFYELCETREEEFKELSLDTIRRILDNDHLQLNSEDQLLAFVNKFYQIDKQYSILYETVLFESVSSEKMKTFTAIYDNEDMSRETWLHLSKRLEKEVEKSEDETGETKRYREKKQSKSIKEFSPNDQNEFNGIVNYLRSQSNNQIENEISITSSTVINSKDCFQPRVVTLFEDKSNYFHSQNAQNNWLCFDFKEHRIIPTCYTIRSAPYGPGWYHPRSWVIECSNDSSSWEVVDEERDCSLLRGSNLVHTFKMNHPTSKEFRYIRMRLTGPDWYNYNYLKVNSFEIYGKLI